MQIEIMREDAINFVKQNIDSLVHYYEEGADPKIWLKENGIQEPFISTEVDFIDKPLSLQVDENKPFAYEIDNIIETYTHMKSLSDSFATDERLWAGLAHTEYYEFMQNRWAKRELNRDSILKHYFFHGYTPPRCYMLNTIASFWWTGRKMYIEGDDEPFRLVKAASRDINGYAFRMLGSNWSNQLNGVKCLIEEVKEYKSEYKRIYGVNISHERELVGDLSTYINALSAVVAIDLCPEEYLKQKIRQQIYRLRGELPVKQNLSAEQLSLNL